MRVIQLGAGGGKGRRGGEGSEGSQLGVRVDTESLPTMKIRSARVKDELANWARLYSTLMSCWGVLGQAQVEDR